MTAASGCPPVRAAGGSLAPILLLSLMDVETGGEMKIPALRYVLALDLLLERWIGPVQRLNNVKSVSVDCVLTGFVPLTWS